jgi:hypothetical protein
VARVLAKIFYAFGPLEMPEVIKATRADLTGEYLGATTIKTNELIDAALGGVLFIDEPAGLGWSWPSARRKVSAMLFCSTSARVAGSGTVSTARACLRCGG